MEKYLDQRIRVKFQGGREGLTEPLCNDMRLMFFLYLSCALHSERDFERIRQVR